MGTMSFVPAPIEYINGLIIAIIINLRQIVTLSWKQNLKFGQSRGVREPLIYSVEKASLDNPKYRKSCASA
jgi:hypothetical protein